MISIEEKTKVYAEFCEGMKALYQKERHGESDGRLCVKWNNYRARVKSTLEGSGNWVTIKLRKRFRLFSLAWYQWSFGQEDGGMPAKHIETVRRFNRALNNSEVAVV